MASTERSFLPAPVRLTAIWLFLVASANIAVCSVLSVLATAPSGIRLSNPWEYVATVTAPIYTPALLLFTAILGVTAMLFERRVSHTDHARAHYEDFYSTMSWVLPVLLVPPLSTAAVVVMHKPEKFAYVALALLLSCLVVLITSGLAPIRNPTSTARLRRARERHESGLRFASASSYLGTSRTNRHALMAGVKLFATSVGFCGIVTVFSAALAWGWELALRPESILLFFALGYGNWIIVAAWTLGADHAMSPLARRWLIATLTTIGGGISVSFGVSLMVATDWPTGWIGVGLISSGLVQVGILFSGLRKRIGPLEEIEQWATHRHLQRTAEAQESAWQAWRLEATVPGRKGLELESLRAAE